MLIVQVNEVVAHVLVVWPVAVPVTVYVIVPPPLEDALQAITKPAFELVTEVIVGVEGRAGATTISTEPTRVAGLNFVCVPFGDELFVPS